MTRLTQRVLDRLRDVDFQVRPGGVSPFEEELPLVTGVAWDEETAQFALVAEGRGEIEAPLWRQLLFAGSGIRHQLDSGDATAFGSPVIIAIVDEQALGELRALSEELVERYVVFNRVDLNLIKEADVADPERLDDALAPLLPRCRRLQGKEISRREVQKFWQVLRAEVESAAMELDSDFGARREAAGREGADELIGDSADSSQLPPPTPIGSMSIKNFRSIEEASIDLADVTILHGPNGGGKTSVVEALELLWAGTSQRKPGDVTAAEYRKHLPKNGDGEFTLSADERTISGLSEQPQAELARCVLTHETISDLVGESPEERFKTLLQVTGLEIPDLDARTIALVTAAKEEADRALRRAGIPELKQRNSPGLEHLKGHLKSNFLKRLAALQDLTSTEKTLASISGGSYVLRKWPGDGQARELLGRADSLIAEVFESRAADHELGDSLDAARDAVEDLLQARSQAAAASRLVLSQIERAAPSGRAAATPEEAAPSRAEEEESEAPIDVELAVRWLSHAQGMTSAAERFRADAGEIGDKTWAERLRRYAEAVGEAAEEAPRNELERWSKPRRLVTPELRMDLEPIAYQQAGFERAPADPEAAVEPLRGLVAALGEHEVVLQAISHELEAHPARKYGPQAETVMQALCKFELARKVRRPGPILQASERMVTELLDDRLAPVLGELVQAMARFDWYFKPLRMTGGDGAIVFGGLATNRKDLDARMTLNSAERTILGLAWFLALHMLQPEDRRQVLVLDDPTSGFDAANRAGFISTLRAFVRLLKPKQILIASHDDAVAAVFAEELAKVDGWPGTVTRLRVQRDEDDCSVVLPEPSPDASRHVKEESERLGLLEDAAPAG